MAMTYEQLAALVEPLEFQRSKNGAYFVRWVGGLDAFKDQDGDFCCLVVVDLAHEGRTAMFIAPKLYDLTDCKHRAAVLEACLKLAFGTKSLNYEYNAETCELRATVEIPLQDSVLTPEQIRRAIFLLIDVLDNSDPVIRHAMRTGVVDLKREGLKAADVERLDREDLVKDLGGIEILRKLVRERGLDHN